MKTETNFLKAGSAALFSGMLALALSPAMPAPLAAAAEESSVNAVVSIIQIYRTNGDASEVTQAGTEDIIGTMSKYEVTVSDLPQEYQNYVLRCELSAVQSELSEVNDDLTTAQDENSSLEKQLKSAQEELQTVQGKLDSLESSNLKNLTKVQGLTVNAKTAGKLTVSWKVANSIEGLSYQVRYKEAGGKWSSVKTKKLTRTFKKLTGGKTYTFKVRAYKKISSKNVYSSWSKNASATVLQSYAKGTYKVKGDLLHVRKTTSVSSDLLVDILRGTKVKVTKVKTVNGIAWGQLTYGGQTGWVQMQYLEKA